MKNILKVFLTIIKIVLLFVVSYLAVGIFFARNEIQLAIGFFVVFFMTLPTYFIVFFKNRFLEKYPKFRGFYKIFLIIYIISVVFYFASWILGAWHLNQQAKIQKTIDFINSQKITIDDVMGKNLPPQPDQIINDSTIAGIDANKNYIRDDVELEIFKKYPDSAKIRAAELQYAQALQLELTQVFNSETLVAVMKKESHAINCIGKTGPKINYNDSHDKIVLDLSITDKNQEEVKDFMINTDLRKNKNSSIFDKYMKGYSSLPGNECDVDFLLLPN